LSLENEKLSILYEYITRSGVMTNSKYPIEDLLFAVRALQVNDWDLDRTFEFLKEDNIDRQEFSYKSFAVHAEGFAEELWKEFFEEKYGPLTNQIESNEQSPTPPVIG